jgi:hypothetical protein
VAETAFDREQLLTALDGRGLEPRSDSLLLCGRDGRDEPHSQRPTCALESHDSLTRTLECS